MREQAFRFRESFRRIRKTKKTLARNCLHADAFYKIGGGKPPALACPTCRRENVIAASEVIAERLSGRWPDEDCAGRSDLPEQGG
jgi:hypothetical protein